jgi:hypothetical protein
MPGTAAGSGALNPGMVFASLDTQNGDDAIGRGFLGVLGS